MEQTSKYGLSQWDAEDRILREDFNADNAKIEAAIKDLETSTAQALAAAGNCNIVVGSYVGTGTHGSSNPNTLTFDFEPKILFLDVSTRVTASGMNSKIPAYSILLRGATEASTATGSTLNVIWNGNSVSWYYDGKGTDYSSTQYNTAEQTYYYIALG